MRLCLLASSKTAAIHLQYHAQTRGVKFSHVIISEPTLHRGKVLDSLRSKNNFELFYVPNINGDECKSVLKGIQPDILVIKTGETILRDRILDIPAVATLNAHPGLLPNYRGMDAVRWALLNGDDIGVSVHIVTADVDGGPIVVRRKMEIKPNETVEEIIERNYYRHHHQAMVDAILEFEAGDQNPEAQDQMLGKQYFKMHSKLRCILDDFIEQSSHYN